ncbi:TrkA C-terminal domain-containing protein, partial [Salinicoccus roseus]
AIKRGEDIIVSPDPTVNIQKEDILIMIGNDDDLTRFEKSLTR